MTTRPRSLQAWLSRSDTLDWEALYKELLPKVYNYFRYRVGDSYLAEDLTAETFEKAWKKQGSYRKDLAGFSTWLFTIARNTAVDHFRRTPDELPLEAADRLPGIDSLEETAERRSEARRLARLLEELSPRERELAALKWGAGLTNRAIASQTGLSESNVGTQLSRIAQKLREEWEKET